MKLVKIPRYCPKCGRRQVRMKGLIYQDEYDTTTGRLKWVWYWGCKQALDGFHRKYFENREQHALRRIKTSDVRKRLEPR